MANVAKRRKERELPFLGLDYHQRAPLLTVWLARREVKFARNCSYQLRRASCMPLNARFGPWRRPARTLLFVKATEIGDRRLKTIKSRCNYIAAWLLGLLDFSSPTLNTSLRWGGPSKSAPISSAKCERWPSRWQVTAAMFASTESENTKFPKAPQSCLNTTTINNPPQHKFRIMSLLEGGAKTKELNRIIRNKYRGRQAWGLRLARERFTWTMEERNIQIIHFGTLRASLAAWFFSDSLLFINDFWFSLSRCLIRRPSFAAYWNSFSRVFD